MNAAATERDAFVFKAQPLLHAGMAAQLDFAARAHDAVPRNGAMGGAEGPGDLAGMAWKARGTRDFAISRDFTSRNLPNRSR